MNFKFDIIEGKTENNPVKAVVYGPEGLGKTTFAAKAPGSLILDTENGSLRVDCRRIRISSWEILTDVVNEVINNPSICETLVIDTMDRAESFAISFICQKNRKVSIEDWPYGRGYVVLQELFSSFYTLLDKVITKGINVIIVAHAKMRKQELPEEQGAFDRWELKLNKQTAPLLKEWADAVLFCNYKTMVISNDSGAKKAVGGERVIYTTHHPCWDAKNRFGLKDELPLDFSSIASIFPEKKTQNTVETPKFEVKPPTLRELLDSEGIEDSELQTIVAKKGKYPIDTPISQYSDDFVQGWIIPNFTKIKALIAKEK